MGSLYGKLNVKLEAASVKLQERFGNGFYRLGWTVGSYPVHVILLALVFSGLCDIGLINVYTVSEPEKLWVSSVNAFAG